MQHDQVHIDGQSAKSCRYLCLRFFRLPAILHFFLGKLVNIIPRKPPWFFFSVINTLWKNFELLSCLVSPLKKKTTKLEHTFRNTQCRYAFCTLTIDIFIQWNIFTVYVSRPQITIAGRVLKFCIRTVTLPTIFQEVNLRNFYTCFLLNTTSIDSILLITLTNILILTITTYWLDMLQWYNAS